MPPSRQNLNIEKVFRLFFPFLFSVIYGHFRNARFILFVCLYTEIFPISLKTKIFRGHFNEFSVVNRRVFENYARPNGFFFLPYFMKYITRRTFLEEKQKASISYQSCSSFFSPEKIIYFFFFIATI